MDRILYFCMAKGRKDIPGYKVQLFRKQVGDFTVYYFQLCGKPLADRVDAIYGEMYKAYLHLQERYRKSEEGLQSFLVYEERFSKWLTELQEPELWRSKWKLPFYYAYSSPENLKWILESLGSSVRFSKACVLGYGAGMREWIGPLAHRVQGMDFYLEFSTKGMEDIQEWLLEEYGMLTQIKLVERDGFGKLRLYNERPVLVIDYSGNNKLAGRELAKGSVWVDMEASESKRHLMENRVTGAEYLSLKTIWQREMLETLDTVSKFAYNT